MRDLVFPNRNEEEFISIGEELGYTSLVFCYNDIKKVRDSKNYQTKLKITTMYFDGKGRDKESITKIDYDNVLKFEQIKSKIVFGFEHVFFKDGMHQRFSGLNQVMCKRFAKNGQIIGMSFSDLLNSKGRVSVLGKISQNLRLLKKYEVKVALGSFSSNPKDMRAPKDIISLFTVLGMETKVAKESSV